MSDVDEEARHQLRVLRARIADHAADVAELTRIVQMLVDGERIDAQDALAAWRRSTSLPTEKKTGGTP